MEVRGARFLAPPELRRPGPNPTLTAVRGTRRKTKRYLTRGRSEPYPANADRNGRCWITARRRELTIASSEPELAELSGSAPLTLAGAVGGVAGTSPSAPERWFRSGRSWQPKPGSSRWTPPYLSAQGAAAWVIAQMLANRNQCRAGLAPLHRPKIVPIGVNGQRFRSRCWEPQ